MRDMRVSRFVLALVALTLALPAVASAQATGTIAFDTTTGISSVTLGGQPALLVGGTASSPAWSPDGATLAYTVANPDTGAQAIRTLPAAGGSSTPVAPLGYSPVFSSNGQQLAFTNNGLFVVSVKGGKAKRIVAGSGRIGTSVVSEAVWMPTGNRILYVSHKLAMPPATGTTRLRSIASKGGRSRAIAVRLPSGWLMSGGLAVNPAGTTLAIGVYQSSAPYTNGIVFVPATGGTASPVTTGYTDPSFSPDGTMICATALPPFPQPPTLAILSSSGALIQQTGITADNCAWQP
jgi:Tol biopolymer transport system component